MNRYHESMEHCAPPPELEEQLREAVLSAEPEPQARTAVYRPRGFFRKALLAAVLAVVLTLSVGAATASVRAFFFSFLRGLRSRPDAGAATAISSTMVRRILIG